MSPIVKRWMCRLTVVGTVAFLAGVGLSMYVGRQLIAPVRRDIGVPPESFGGEVVEFSSESGGTIVGWLNENEGADASILLLHGVRADRRSMMDRAKYLKEQGYSTLCIDLQAHGESTRRHITMGYLEAMDAASGVRFLRERFVDLPIGVVGTSLGGAAALMADYKEPPDALVVEAVFADVETGVSNRLEMRLGRVGPLLSPLLTWQISPLLGIDVDILNPVRFAEKVKQPVFVIYGSEDRRSRPSEARAIYAALAGPKQIWEVKGASHVDFHRFSSSEYERRVAEFLASNLRSRP